MSAKRSSVGIIQRIHKSPEAATVGGLSRDGALLSYTHAERGDSRNPDLRVATVDGTVVAELSDGPGHGVAGVGWSPVAGDQRLLVLRNVTGQRRPALHTGVIPAARERCVRPAEGFC